MPFKSVELVCLVRAVEQDDVTELYSKSDGFKICKQQAVELALCVMPDVKAVALRL